MKIEKLKKEFIGVGEVKGFTFRQLFENDNAYIYKVNEHFEVVMKKHSPVCIDFEKRIYSETEFKETYPKGNKFGIEAWNYGSIENALEKFNALGV
jgi:hypothetical protein